MKNKKDFSKHINYLCKKYKNYSSLRFNDLKSVCWMELLNLEGQSKDEEWIKCRLEKKIQREIKKEGYLIHIPEYVHNKIIKVRKGEVEQTNELKRVSKMMEVGNLNYELHSSIPTPEEEYQREEFRKIIKEFQEKFMTEKEKRIFNNFYGLGDELTSDDKYVRRNFKNKFNRSREMKEFIRKNKEIIFKFIK